MKSITVSKAWAASMLAFAAGRGVDVDRLCADLGVISPRDQSVQRLPLDEVVALWDACARASGDPHFGLHFGRQVRPGTFQVVGYTLMSCATLGDALEKLNRYQRVISEGGRIYSQVNGRALKLWYEPCPDRHPFVYHQIDAVLAAIVAFTGWITGVRMAPAQIGVRHQPVGDVAEYTKALGGTVEFGARQNRLVLPREYLKLPLIDSDPELSALHEDQARQHLDRLRTDASLVERVEHLLRSHSSGHRLSRAQAADALGMSERTLQRRLEKAGTSYRELSERGLVRDASRLLSDTDLSLQQIAVQLGFSDASAFYRAFRRWTGESPGQWRNR